MTNIAILDTGFGDSGKGRVAHAFSPGYDYLIRTGGGNNCGHTIHTNGKKYVHHLVPSIDFANSSAKGFLGAGMVIDLEALFIELNALEKDFPGVSKRICVDPDAFLVLEEHKQMDREKNAHIGSTNKGIGPAYLDKMARSGIRVREHLNDKKPIIAALQKLGVGFKPVGELKEEMSKCKLLFEGAQGVLLDINHGTYPYVTCSDCTVAGIFSSGFGFAMPTKVYGVSKPYFTRVGNGPLPTEIKDEAADKLRKLGDEWGATTGRPRRVGWLDLPGIKYAVEKGGITDLIITKLDILNGFGKIPVCFKYDKLPVSGTDFFNAKVSLMEVPGWENAKDYEQIKEFIHSVEYFTGVKVAYVSCGVDRLDLLKV